MKENRNTKITFRNDDAASRHISGYALVFNSESNDLGGFIEIIDKGAVTDETIKNSDVFALLDHNKDRGVLARSKYGEGSLTLSIDDHGLRYEFDAPNTALGDEVLEGIKRGDITTSSFAFTVEEDTWEKRSDGTVLRTIHKINRLFDVSPVFSAAYDETEVTVDTRGLKALLEREEEDNNSNIDINMKKTNKRSAKRSDKEEILDKIKALMAELEDEKDEKEVEAVSDEEVIDDKEDVKEDNGKEVEEAECNPEDKEEEVEEKADETEEDKEATEEPKEDEEGEEVVDENKEEKEENRNNNININKRHNVMKKFSLIKTINDVVNNRSLDDTAKAVIKEGRNAMAKAGISNTGNIVLPVEQRVEGDETAVRSILAQTVTKGKENVATEKLDILEPLRANMVMAKAGTTYLTGLVGDVSIPAYSGSQCAWKGETIAADAGDGSWTEITLSPKRITAYVDVSTQFLVQDSNDADQMLRRDILNALSEKLEATILGSEAGDINKPAGLFNGVAADTAAFKFADVVDMEAELEEKNVNDYVYVVSPSAKAKLRTCAKDSGSGRFVMEDSEIEGREVYVSSAVAKKGLVIGDFKDYVIAQWGGVEIITDIYSKATEGIVRLVVNAYFDAKPRRDSFVTRILK